MKLLPAYAVKLVRQVDEELKKPDWQTNNYGTQNVLLNDVINVLNDAVLPSLIVPLDASDPDSTALNIYNDATMAWAHGDEGLASAEDQSRRQKGNTLLQSDGLVSIIKENVVKELLKLNDNSKYLGISKILKTPFNETDNQEEVISLSTGMQVIMGFLVPGFIYGDFSFSDLMQILSWPGPDVLAARLPESMNIFLKDNLLGKVAAMQLAYATDTNIPNDSKYSFSITEDDPIPEPASEKYVWVRVEWDDDSDKDGIRPDFAKVNLLKGEEVIGEPFILNEGNNWFGTFTGLDPVIKYDVKVEMRDFINGNKETGYEISYQRVREDPLGDYYQIILTHTPNKSVEPGPRHIDFYRIGDLSWLYDRQLPGTGFSASRVTELRERPQGMVYGTTGLTLQIPELGVSETIMTVPKVDGEYPVEWLGSAIGLLEQSSLPGKGVSVLAGHNHQNSTEAGPFLSLGSLESGDRVMVTDARNGMQMYRVYGNYKIASNAFASIAGNVRENALVLITCEDESVDGGYLNRRVILAEPVGK